MPGLPSGTPTVSGEQGIAVPSLIQGFMHGFLTVTSADNQTIAAMIAPVSGQIRYVVAAASAGGTTTVLDVLNNGQSVWTNPSDRPTLVGASAGKFASGRVNRSAVRTGDVLEIVVVTAGNKSRLVATVAVEDPTQRGG